MSTPIVCVPLFIFVHLFATYFVFWLASSARCGCYTIYGLFVCVCGENECGSVGYDDVVIVDLVARTILSTIHYKLSEENVICLITIAIVYKYGLLITIFRQCQWKRIFDILFFLSLFSFFPSFFFARTSNSCVSFSHGIYFPSSFRCSSLSVQTTKFVSFTSVDLHNLIDKSVQNQETHLYSWLMHAPRIQRNKKVLQYPIDKRYGKVENDGMKERQPTRRLT